MSQIEMKSVLFCKEMFTYILTTEAQSFFTEVTEVLKKIVLQSKTQAHKSLQSAHLCVLPIARASVNEKILQNYATSVLMFLSNRTFILFLLLGTSLFAQSNKQAILDSASSLYQKGKYEQSTLQLEKLNKDDYQSPELYGALGNAYYKQNSIGKAILYYEKALKLNPSNTDLQDNLALANAKKIDKSPELSFSLKHALRDFNATFSYNQMAGIAIVLILVSSALLIFFRMKNVVKKVLFLSLSIYGLSALILCFAFYQQNSILQIKEAIVISSAAEIKNEPFTTSSTLVTVHEGSKVSIQNTSGNWLEVKINDQKGWIEKSALEEI